MPDPSAANLIDDTVFPLRIAEGAQGGPGFKTGILTLFAGSEQRCQNWLDPLLRWNVSFGVKNKADLAALTSFFRARGGRNRGFLFQDPLDNQAYRQPIGTGDGTQTQFQLARYYVTERVQARPITRPVQGSITVYLNGVASSGWTCDHTTGLVVFGAAPAAGVAVTADFQFYVPARFDSDSMASHLEGGTVTGWDSIPIVEVRERWSVPIAAAPAAVAASFPDLVSRQVGGPMHGTQIATSVSGWEERASQWTAGRLRWELEENTLAWADAQNLLYWFRTHAGRAIAFNMKDWTDYHLASEPMVAVGAVGTQWQLVKRYLDGGVTIVRNIVAPVLSTLTIVDVNNAPLSGYTVSSTGVVTLASGIAQAPRATCDFLVPVRFDSDSLLMRHVNGRQWTVEGLSVVEAPV